MAEFKAKSVGEPTPKPNKEDKKEQVNPDESWKFLDYLAFIYQVDKSEFHFDFPGEDKETAPETSPIQTISFDDWLSQYEITEDAELPQTPQDELKVKLDLPFGDKQQEIIVSATSVYSELNTSSPPDALVGALKMAALIKANPAHKNGLDLEGNEEERLYLYLAAVKYGFDQYINAETIPQHAHSFLESNADQLDIAWKSFNKVMNIPLNVTKPSDDNADNNNADNDQEETAEADEQDADEQEADETPESLPLEGEAREFMSLHIKRDANITPTDEQLDAIWNEFSPQLQQQLIDASAEHIESLKANIEEIQNKAEEVETDLTAPLKDIISQDIVNSVKQLIIQYSSGGDQRMSQMLHFKMQNWDMGELSDEQFNEFWSSLTEQSRLGAKLRFDPEPEYLEYAKKHAFVQAQVTLTDEQTKEYWKNIKPEQHLAISANFEDALADVEKELGKLNVQIGENATAVIKAGLAVKERLKRELTEILPVANITDAQVAEYYTNNYAGGVAIAFEEPATEAEEEAIALPEHQEDDAVDEVIALPEHIDSEAEEADTATEDTAIEENAITEEKAESENTSIKVTKAQQRRFKAFLREEFGKSVYHNADKLRQTWNNMDAQKQQELLDATGVKNDEHLSAVASAVVAKGADEIIDRHISDAAYAILDEHNIDEETYRVSAALVVNLGSARSKDVKAELGLSASKVSAILKAMDADGLTSYTPGQPRKLERTTEGGVRLTSKAFDDAAHAEPKAETNIGAELDEITELLGLSEENEVTGIFATALDEEDFPCALADAAAARFSAEANSEIVNGWNNIDAEQRTQILRILQHDTEKCPKAKATQVVKPS